jgi:uncharacterized secreted protein with C-terminal beta-propeller domain
MSRFEFRRRIKPPATGPRSKGLRSNCRATIRRSPFGAGFESLEGRSLLDAAGVVPVADAYTVRTNGPSQLLAVLNNDRFDSDYQGARRITAVSNGSEGGSIEIGSDRSAIHYAPPVGFAGTERFSYFVDDQALGMVTITVESPAVDDAVGAFPDGSSIAIDVLANDRFLPTERGPIRITAVGHTSLGGEATVSADGKSILYQAPAELPVTYVPQKGELEDRFVYVVDDAFVANVRVALPLPVRNDAFADLVQNSDVVPLNLLSNDPFWAAYPFPRRITSVDRESLRGTLTLEPDGQFVSYQPAVDFYGQESFTNVVDDRYEARARMTVHRPVVDDHFGQIDTGSDFVALDLLGNDVYYVAYDARRDVVDGITAVGPSTNGATIFISDDLQGVRYRPPADFIGVDTFEYLADHRYKATVSVSVTRPVRDDSLQVIQDIPSEFDPLTNDFSGPGYAGPRRITAVGGSTAGGRARIVGDGTRVYYEPPEAFVGTEQFSYTVDDTLDAQVSVQVLPRARDDYFEFSCITGPGFTTILDPLANDKHQSPTGNRPKITSLTPDADPGLAGGRISIVSSGGGNDDRVHYQMSKLGADRFEYQVDGKYSGTARIWLAPASSPSADQLVVDQNSSAELDLAVNDFSYRNSVWRNGAIVSCDPYRGPRHIDAITPPAHGTVHRLPDGHSIRYEPDPDFVGTDSFSYSVDGIFETPVSVQVVRWVHDDAYRVPVGSQDNSLPVLVNDLFGNYSGAKKITSVSGQTRGKLAVTADGQSIVYTPASGFAGQEEFTYLVDGRLKANVRVDVRGGTSGETSGGTSGETSTNFGRFKSSEALRAYLLEQSLSRYAGLFGQPVYPPYFDTLYAAADGGPVTATETRSHSSTNVQVAGIDEGDLIEVDDTYLYSIHGGDVAITRAWPADEIEVISTSTVEGAPFALYLRGNRLTVLSTVWEAEPPAPEPASEPASTMIADVARPAFFPMPQRKSTTLVTVLDVADRAAPVVVQRTRLEGEYAGSRGLGDFVYLVLRHDGVLPLPKTRCDARPARTGIVADWFAPPARCVYESKEEYLARWHNTPSETIQSALPRYASSGPDGELVRSGLLVAATDVYLPQFPDADQLIAVVSIHVMGNDPGIASSNALFAGSASQIYGAAEHLYVFDNSGSESRWTNILRFDWDAISGGIELSAKGAVPGVMLNQFSADEYRGDLRIVTAAHNDDRRSPAGQEENELFVLRADDGLLEFRGSLQRFALGERIQSVRFDGDRALVTTFRNIDPLVIIDVADPEAPRLAGQVTLPGFSSYMQWIDRDHVLTAGRNTSAGWSGPTQVALFDVSDLTHPFLVDSLTLPRWVTSEAEQDHHAFSWFAEHAVLALPTARMRRVRVDRDGDGVRESSEVRREDDLVLVGVDASLHERSDRGLLLAGSVPNDSAVRRSAFIDQVLYAVAEEGIVAVDVAMPDRILGHVTIEPRVPNPETTPPPDGDPIPLFADLISAIAASRGTTRGNISLITSERSANGPASQHVIEVDGTQMLYEFQPDGTTRLADSNFQFGRKATATQPEDTNGDGILAPLDALLVINDLNANGSRRLAQQAVVRQVQAVKNYANDVNGDGFLSALDAVRVINRLNHDLLPQPSLPASTAPAGSGGEGESSPLRFDSNWHLSVDQVMAEFARLPMARRR